MTYIFYNIEKKLKKSVINEKNYFAVIDYTCANDAISHTDSKNVKISFIVKKLLFKFLVFFSKKLRNKKKNIKNLLLFFKFYRYYNTFFFNNKIFFYKKYFSKKNYNLFYFEKFFLSTKQVRLKSCLHRLKSKKIAFYKKYIWAKNKKFRKKNILIFNKKFFKLYTSTRFKPFIVDSLLPFFRVKKIKKLRFFKKRLFGLLHRKYYYLFLHKRHTFSLHKKRRNKYQKKIISYNFRYRTYAKIFVNRRFFATRRRKRWRQVYFAKRRRRTFFRLLFCGFNNKIFNKVFFNKYKTRNNYFTYVLREYLETYAAKLANKYVKDKGFYKRFFLKRRSYKRFKNVVYFFKWKPKTLYFHFLNAFKQNKNLKKILFSAIWLKFNYNKIFWRKKKNSKAFFLFYYNNFFLNKTFLLFNFLFKAKFGFLKSKRLRKRRRLKRRRFTIYLKKIRRRVIKLKIKRKFVKHFLILLFFKLMKKHKKASRIFIFRNALFLSYFKKIKLSLLSSILLGKDPLYFKNHTFLNSDINNFKKNLKIISLLKKNNF